MRHTDTAAAVVPPGKQDASANSSAPATADVEKDELAPLAAAPPSKEAPTKVKHQHLRVSSTLNGV